MTPLKVRDIMKTGTVTFRTGTTVREAASRMAEQGVQGAPVLDKRGRIIGIVTEDIILSYIRGMDESIGDEASLLMFDRCYSDQKISKTSCLAYEKAGSAEVGDIMTEEELTLSPEEDIDEAIATMIRFDVNRIPVVQNGRYLGMAEKEDLIWAWHRILRDRMQSGRE